MAKYSIGNYPYSGDALRRLRGASGLTQEQVQAATGISRTEISRCESGSKLPPSAVLLRLALFYGTSLDHIIGLTEHKRPYPRIRSGQRMKAYPQGQENPPKTETT